MTNTATTHLSLHHLLPLWVILGDGFLLGGDDLNAAHEDVRGDGDAYKDVRYGETVEQTTQPLRPEVLCRQQ